MKTVELFIKGVILFGILCVFSSCNALKRGMASSEYYNYLREDTVICELNTFTVEPSFESVLKTAIKAWEDCPICKEDPHPFVFEIEEILQGDTLTYTIKTNSSPKIAHHYYSGAFSYKEYEFAVVKKSVDKSMFAYNEKNEPTKIFFCDRIHSSKCGLIIECQCVNENCKVISVECQEAGIIKIN